VTFEEKQGKSKRNWQVQTSSSSSHFVLCSDVFLSFFHVLISQRNVSVQDRGGPHGAESSRGGARGEVRGHESGLGMGRAFG